MIPTKRESRAVYLHGSSIASGENEYFSVFEEKKSLLVCGSAHPSSDSRGNIACPRALDIAVDCFLERPSSSETAVETIAGFINEEIYGLQEKDKAFLCSIAMLYVFKGSTRVFPAGNAAVLFYENGVLKNEWYGDGTPMGMKAECRFIYSDEFELTEDSRFILVTGENRESVGSAVDFFKDNNGNGPEDPDEFFKGRQCSFVNLFLPKRERRGFLR